MASMAGTRLLDGGRDAPRTDCRSRREAVSIWWRLDADMDGYTCDRIDAARRVGPGAVGVNAEDSRIFVDVRVVGGLVRVQVVDRMEHVGWRPVLSEIVNNKRGDVVENHVVVGDVVLEGRNHEDVLTPEVTRAMRGCGSTFDCWTDYQRGQRIKGGPWASGGQDGVGVEEQGGRRGT